MPSTGPYRGTVRTMSGNFPGSSAIAYDRDSNDLFVAQAGAFGSGTTLISRVSRGGHSTQLASISGLVTGLVYDAVTKMVYVAATSSYAILAMSPQTGAVTIIAGGNRGTADGQGTAAQFQGPQGIAVDNTGQNLYATDIDRIRKITVGGTVTTTTAPGSIGSQACTYSQYENVAFDIRDGNLYVVDSCTNLVQQVVPATGAVNTVAGQCVNNGNNQCELLWGDGSRSRALFAQPYAIAYNPANGRLYVADAQNSDIRELTVHGNVVTLAGSGHLEQRDGVGPSAGFYYPEAIAAAPNGLLYVGDDDPTYNGGLIRTVVSVGPSPPPQPHGMILYESPTVGGQPYSLTTTSDGSIWFSEPNVYKIGRVFPSGRIREYALPTTYQPLNILSDAAGNIWFIAGYYANQAVQIGKLTPAGVVTFYPLPQTLYTTGFTLGGDGNFWFVSFNVLGYMTPIGTVVEYVSDQASYVASGHDGSLWSTGSGFVDDTSTSGKLLKKYEYAPLVSGPLTRGPGGRMWFGQPQAIGEVLAENLLLYTLPSPPPNQYNSWDPSSIVEGSDHALWFTARAPGYIGRLTTTGRFGAFEITAPRSAPTSIIVGPNGVTWFADPGAAKFGRLY